MSKRKSHRSGRPSHPKGFLPVLGFRFMQLFCCSCLVFGVFCFVSLMESHWNLAAFVKSPIVPGQEKAFRSTVELMSQRLTPLNALNLSLVFLAHQVGLSGLSGATFLLLSYKRKLSRFWRSFKPSLPIASALLFLIIVLWIVFICAPYGYAGAALLGVSSLLSLVAGFHGTLLLLSRS